MSSEYPLRRGVPTSPPELVLRSGHNACCQVNFVGGDGHLVTDAFPDALPPGSVTLSNAGLPMCLSCHILHRDIVPIAQPADSFLHGPVQVKRDPLGGPKGTVSFDPYCKRPRSRPATSYDELGFRCPTCEVSRLSLHRECPERVPDQS